jgi:hypothetical protein
MVKQREKPGARTKKDGISERGKPRESATIKALEKALERARAGERVEEKRVVRTSYGNSRCLYCRKTFERQRPWSKYDTPYCRMMHWHTTNRRKTAPGQIVEIDGVLLDQPLPAIDKKLEEKVARETSELMKRTGR